jgi:hypothetical protein
MMPPLLLISWQLAADHSDNQRIVAGEQQVNPHDTEKRGPEHSIHDVSFE